MSDAEPGRQHGEIREDDSAMRPRLVLVGQTPPPVHGQALAIERLVRGHFRSIDIFYARMDFSVSIQELGRVTPAKVFRLARLIWRVFRLRVMSGARTLYYPAPGPSLKPLLRDIVFLLAVRPFFPNLILDFHAGGLDEGASRLPIPIRWLLHRAFDGASLAIEHYPSSAGPDAVAALRRVVVPYGIEDEYHRFARVRRNSDGPMTVLFVGLLTPSKGIWTLLEAVAASRARGVDVEAVLVGEFTSDRVHEEWTEMTRRLSVDGHVHHRGRLVGDEKWAAFAAADVFCFPSYYENEGFPIVILEAMQFRLPVVASNWRGIPYMVQDGVTGFIVPPRDPDGMAEIIERLGQNPEIRRRMGERAREIFLQRYTVEPYLSSMEQAFLSVTGEQP